MENLLFLDYLSLEHFFTEKHTIVTLFSLYQALCLIKLTFSEAGASYVIALPIWDRIMKLDTSFYPQS